eukprot:PhF_6_TR25097/c1_g1_i6/m.34481
MGCCCSQENKAKPVTRQQPAPAPVKPALPPPPPPPPQPVQEVPSTKPVVETAPPTPQPPLPAAASFVVTNDHPQKKIVAAHVVEAAPAPVLDNVTIQESMKYEPEPEPS